MRAGDPARDGAKIALEAASSGRARPLSNEKCVCRRRKQNGNGMCVSSPSAGEEEA